MKMPLLTVILLCSLPLQITGQDITHIVNAFQQACPYTNFCQQNASQTIQDASQAACCRQCSCADDCWKRDNCCPDKIIKEDEITGERETCRSTFVKKSIFSFDAYDQTNGFDKNGKRYFVTETCPGTTNDGYLRRKCSGIAETFTDLTWVSDAKTNTIYKNRYCAECNGVRKYKSWGLSTTCQSLLDAPVYSQNVSSFPTTCTLTVIPPNRKAYDNQCLVPDISTCSETGFWQSKATFMKSLCESHPLLFVHEDLNRAIIYRNVFCYQCNSPPNANAQGIFVKDENRGQKSVPSAFTVLFNIFEADEELEMEHQCEIDEVEDPLKRTCLKLICPGTQFPRHGSCQKSFSEIYFLGITITYRLQTNWNKLKYGTREAMGYNVFGLGEHIRRQIYDDLGLGLCGSCYGLFFKSNMEEIIGNAQIPTFFEFWPLFYTYGRHCSQSLIVDAMTNLSGKELTVYTEDEYVTFDIEIIDDTDESQRNTTDLFLPKFEDEDNFCGIRLVKNYHDLIGCPTVELDSTHNQHLISLTTTEAQKSHVKSLFVVDDGQAVPSIQMNSTPVCWEDYRKAVLSLVSSSRMYSGNIIVTVMVSSVSVMVVSAICYYL